ncbi:MAG: hypothetical protein N2109_09345 [Fimbriimonadales bacterium]|nr:hypothetical protein [Fimbriimonadales bacterium]
MFGWLLVPLLALPSDGSDAGRTLSAQEARRLSLPPQPLRGDTGIQVLLDHAHQATFSMMWDWVPWAQSLGFRVVGSHASLDAVLNERGRSRIRVPDGRRRPFAWWPNPKFNVVVTYQLGYSRQEYLHEERRALERFVRSGGGALLLVAPPSNTEPYSLREVLREWGCELADGAASLAGQRVAALRLGADWTVLERADGGEPAAAWRPLGRGRLAVADHRLLAFPGDAPPEGPLRREARERRLVSWLRHLSEGRKPIGGPPNLPNADVGVGGPIYPELEERVEGAVVFYAKNQTKRVLECVRRDVPRVDHQVRAWCPSPAPKDPMFLILAAGEGGGWAVNMYEPKEVGIISADPDGILSILAHEVAHTCYAGPPNPHGRTAGRLPEVFSEAHAGWFQRKADFWRTGKTGHDANRLFQFDPDATKLDLAKAGDYPYGQAWTKLWWLWQKLDERYGPTWYVRWMWVKNTRWDSEPERALSWDDVVEDMSLAVGEDLFPMMRRIGTTLSRDRWPEGEFQGRRIRLAPAEFDLTPAGDPITEPIGDWRKPLPPKK